jgi:hypothetical protein
MAGKFSSQIESQDNGDPLLVLAQNILAEKKAGSDIYLDLGNAFYPGVLSKFSLGSVMMDYLDFFSCDATLVSSNDLLLGIKNLEFIRENHTARLLSANIYRSDAPVFLPYFTLHVKGTPIAFVGVSSKKINFQIAEKNLYGTALMEEKTALERALKSIEADGTRHVCLLSGLALNETVELLHTFDQIDLALCGGDYSGDLFGIKTARIDLADGRSIAMFDDTIDYYMLHLSVGDAIAIDKIERRKATPRKIEADSYQAFVSRLSLWKRKFLSEQHEPVADVADRTLTLDDPRLAQLMRDRFDSEVAVVENHTISPHPAAGAIRHADLLGMVNLDYNVFVFTLTGEQVAAVDRERSGLTLTGLEHREGPEIQGYPIVKNRIYRVAATQSAYEKIERIVRTEIPYENSWLTVSDLLHEDLQNKRTLLRRDYAYLDERFRTMIDIHLSNIVDDAHVEWNSQGEAPVGHPRESYIKWGLENRIDLTFYNRYHRFVLTPYMYYMRQDEIYLHNLLRGTFLYDYNYSEIFRPYNKLQADTVVETVDGRRPLLLRETAGIAMFTQYVNAKLGVGFEEQVRDPSETPLYGFEVIVGIRYPFWKYVTYVFDLDSFFALRSEETDRLRVRASIENGIFVALNHYLGLSLKHKYFYLHEAETETDYRDSQIITSIDLNSQWKFW